jgi:hypothetical protein
VEQLEGRDVPAGNITTFVQGGVLFLVGDDLANGVWVAATGGQSAIVRPLEGTTINGSTSAQSFSGIKRGYDIRLNGGADVASVVGIDAKQGLRIEMGDDRDDLYLERIKSRRNATVLLGADNDILTITQSEFRRRTAIDLGDGNDRLSVSGSKFGKNTFIVGGAGSDARGITRTGFEKRTQLTGFENAFSFALPKAVSDTATVAAGQTITIAVLANDLPNGGTIDPGSLTITGNPGFGRVVANANGTFTYTSTRTTAGDDAILYTYRTTNGLVSNEAEVRITVTGDPTSPPTDTTPPTTTLTTSATDAPPGTPISFTTIFSEPVTDFVSSDVQVTNGSVSNFAALSATTYTFTVTSNGSVPVTVDVPGGAAKDAASNLNLAATRTVLPSPNDPNWQNLNDGLRFWDVVPGTGTAVQANSTISVFYTGWLVDGTVFDSNASGTTPASFPMTSLIQGWQQGLVGMQVGGTRRLYIPSALGYGPNGSPPRIPGNADLVFDIRLVGVT